MVFTCLPYKSFENIVVKGESALNEQFLLSLQFRAMSPFPIVFYNPLGDFSAIFIQFKIVFCKLSKCGRVWNLSFGKGLTLSLPMLPWISFGDGMVSDQTSTKDAVWSLICAIHRLILICNQIHLKKKQKYTSRPWEMSKFIIWYGKS